MQSLFLICSPRFEEKCMPDDNDPQHQPARYANGRFGPGNPGKPRGSRNRTASRVVKAIFADFETNQDQFLKELRSYARPEYMRTILKLLPQQVEATAETTADWTSEERARTYHEAKRLLAIEADPEIALAQLEALLSGDAAEGMAP